MRRQWMAMPIGLLMAGVLAAQPLEPKQAQLLDATLHGWEQAMAKLDCFAVGCRRTKTDKAFGTVETYTGTAQFCRGAAGKPSQVHVKLASTKYANQYDELLYTGTRLYLWLPATKVLQVQELPPTQAGQPLIDDNVTALLFGITAQAARERYELAWLPPDKDYYYIAIRPRRPADRAEFTEAQLALTVAGLLPGGLRYRQPNGNEVQWRFVELKKNAAAGITAQSFAPPKTPPGWRVDVVRPPVTPAAGPAPKR